MILFSFLLFALLLINPVIAEDFNQTIYSSDSMISDYSNSTNNQLYVDEEKSVDENNIETDYLEDNIGEYENNILDKLVCSLGNSLYHNKLTSTKQLFQTSFLDSIDGFYYDAFLNSCGFHEND